MAFLLNFQLGRYQSGQLGRTVTPLTYVFVGSNPALPTSKGSVEKTEPFFVSILSILFATFKPNDMSMLVKIYPENPNDKEIRKVVDILRNGGIVIYPTDTIYGIGCDINNARAVEKVARIKDINLKKANLSFILLRLKPHLGFYQTFEQPCF